MARATAVVTYDPKARGGPNLLYRRSASARAVAQIAGDGVVGTLSVVSGIANGTKAMEATLREAVGLAREQGASWDEIGTALGVSRQAAWERFAGD